MEPLETGLSTPGPRAQEPRNEPHAQPATESGLTPEVTPTAEPLEPGTETNGKPTQSAQSTIKTDKADGAQSDAAANPIADDQMDMATSNGADAQPGDPQDTDDVTVRGRAQQAQSDMPANEDASAPADDQTDAQSTTTGPQTGDSQDDASVGEYADLEPDDRASAPTRTKWWQETGEPNVVVIKPSSAQDGEPDAGVGESAAMQAKWWQETQDDAKAEETGERDVMVFDPSPSARDEQQDSGPDPDGRRVVVIDTMEMGPAGAAEEAARPVGPPAGVGPAERWLGLLGGKRDIGRREALGLGLLGVLGLGTASSLIAGDRKVTAAAHPQHRHLAHARPARPHVVTPTPTPTPTAPPPVQPIAAWTKPAYKLTEIRTDLPPNSLALTIDDGPHPEWTPRVLDLLDKYHVKATFCLIGEQIEDNAKVVRMMVEAGHEVANHTWSHPIEIAHLSQDRVDRELSKAHRRIVEVTAQNPRFFRAPGGNWSPEVFRSAAQLGMIPIEWDNDPRDWSRPGTDHIVRQMLQASAGDILLCHDGGGDRSETLSALRTVIPALQGRGLQFVTL